ncbi:MAG: glutamine-synthetase adenylyltransferase, partial [Alphaproteobacteria bacterium]|nr:glutamine-synthetase adenylyltransferase [Alphaproteobacteria bacterium]
IGGGFFADWPGVEALTTALAEVLAEEDDYEARLNATRRWRNEWQFRVGVHHLRGLITGDEAGRSYADIADAVLAALWEPVVEEFATKHGPPPGRGAMVLGMGSLGARALTVTSDLDLIVIYDPAGVEMSDGRRPLASRAYYARLTQAFVTALSAPMGDGRLYEVDMRLRPSGRQGPVATSLASFQSYQSTDAWTWEHLALTRARAVAGEADLGAEVEAFRRDLLAKGRDGAKTRSDVADMRARLAEAKPVGGVWDVKLGAGRMQDIALLAQTGALLAGAPDRGTLDQIAAGAGALGLSKAEVRTLGDAKTLFWRVQAASRLMTAGMFDPDEVGTGGRAFLLRETEAADIAALEAKVSKAAADAAAIIDRALAAK